MTNSISLTPDQKSAIKSLDMSVSVSAGAGSGKTEVLIQRFCRIVEEGMATPEEVLTVTFTEKAAKEMKERITRRFSELARDEDRRAVESAYIGTIHSFCKRVLAENAFEAGVDPRFRILDESEKGIISNQILDELIEAECTDESILLFVQDAGIESLRQMILDIYSYIRSLGQSPGPSQAAGMSDPESYLLDFNREFSELKLTAVNPSPALGKMMESLQESEAGVRDAISRLISSGDNSNFDWNAVEQLRRYCKVFDARAGSADIKAHTKAARNTLEKFISACIDIPAYRNSTILLSLASKFDARYAEVKRRLGVLDYDDLLIKTKLLFTNSDGMPTDTAIKYRNRFKFITLDEFQDTNPLQKQIIDAISGVDNVFTVGDIKQSIYGFIHSDVDVFDAHHRNIRNGKGNSISFRENFRSREGIIDFVNSFFSELWSEDADFEFEPLLYSGDFCAKSIPDVELLFVPKTGASGKDDIESGRRNEANAIARKILQITAPEGDGTLYRTKKSQAGKPLKLSDIVILFRATSDMHLYERMLSEYGIETYSVSGRGFYGTPEIRDVISLLGAVNNPLDDISMAAVLRSPFAGISSDALFWLCRDWSTTNPGPESMPSLNERSGKIREAINRLDSIKFLSDEDRPLIEAFSSMFRDLLNIRSQPRITDILDIALEQSGFRNRLLAMRNGRRKYANICKLYEIAQNFQSANLFGLQDFIRHLKDMELLGEREMEAATESEYGDVVRLMTIHKAKGLQAPVIFIADMSHCITPKRKSAIFAKNRGLSMQVRNPLTYAPESPLSYMENAEINKQRELAESKRLLYVAMTRAEEHLFLVGCSELKGVDKSSYYDVTSWTGWVERALGLTSDQQDGEIDFGGQRLAFRRIFDVEKPPVADIRLPSLISQYPDTFLESTPLAYSTAQDASDAARDAYNRCFDGSSLMKYSVSKLSVSQVLDYIECPARYRAIHLIGMPDSESEMADEYNDGNGLSSADFGHMVHNLLDRMDFTADPESQCERLLSDVDDDMLQVQIQPLITGFTRTRWYKELRNSVSVIKESPFQFMLDGCLLSGRMDVLYKGPDGWTVLDYKTGRAEDRERYELQTGIYAYAASKLTGEMPSTTALVLLSLNDEWAQSTSDGVLAKNASETICRVSAMISDGYFEPKPGKTCSWCPSAQICPAKLSL